MVCQKRGAASFAKNRFKRCDSIRALCPLTPTLAAAQYMVDVVGEGESLVLGISNFVEPEYILRSNDSPAIGFGIFGSFIC